MRTLILAAALLPLLACPVLAKDSITSRSKAFWSEVKVVTDSTTVRAPSAESRGYGLDVGLRRDRWQDKDPSPARPRLRFHKIQ